MSRIEKRVIVNGSIERLFTYVPEVKQTLELWPGLLEVGEVQRLPLGGVFARWIFRTTGLLFVELDKRCEPLVDSASSLTLLGDFDCAMKWAFQFNTHLPALNLDGDYTYWSLC